MTSVMRCLDAKDITKARHTLSNYNSSWRINKPAINRSHQAHIDSYDALVR